MISFKKKDYEKFTIVEFKLDEPAQATCEFFEEVRRKLEELDLKYNRGIIVSGRGPIWLYCFLFHRLHPAKWLGVFDPRLSGGVVVQSHVPGIREGEIIKIDY